MNHYHNTTEAVDPQLKQYEAKAKSQEEILLAHFESMLPAYILLTPTSALERVFSNRVPITSVRRALSNLTRDGKLVKAGKAMGPYGRPENYWKLVYQDPQQEMF